MPSVTERPPLELCAELQNTDGTTIRLDAGATDPGNRPHGISFRTARYDGFKDAGFTLNRRIDQPQRDLALFNLLRFVGASGDIAYEGRIAGLPRSTGNPATWSIQAAGLMANARDRKFQMPFVDRAITQWTVPSLPRRAQLAAASVGQGQIPAAISAGGIVWDVPNEALPAAEESDVMYDAGEGVKIARVDYQGTRVGASWAGSFQALTVFASDVESFASGVSSETLTLDSTAHVAGSFTPSRYLLLAARTTSAVTPAVGHQQRYDILSVIGDHGLTLPASGDGIGGVLASDVLTWLIERYCPQLNASGVQATTYPIGHLAFHDRTFPYDAFLTVNSFHRWGLECWENGTVYFRPLDLTDYDWELRLGDFGTTLDVSGAVSEEVANGIEITYTDASTGQTRTLLPDDYAELRDTNPLNPANRAGLYKATDFTINSTATLQDALQIGRSALAQFNAPKHKGSASREGYIKDRGGNWQPVWKVRAGDRVLITDSVDEEVHVVFETDYSHEPRPTIRIAVDDSFQMLDAYLDRYSNAFQARGL